MPTLFVQSQGVSCKVQRHTCCCGCLKLALRVVGMWGWRKRVWREREEMGEGGRERHEEQSAAFAGSRGGGRRGQTRSSRGAVLEQVRSRRGAGEEVPQSRRREQARSVIFRSQTPKFDDSFTFWSSREESSTTVSHSGTPGRKVRRQFHTLELQGGKFDDSFTF